MPRRSVLATSMLIAAAGIIAWAVYHVSQPGKGAIPPIPAPHIDGDALRDAQKRLYALADDFRWDDYATAVRGAYVEVNRAALSGDAGAYRQAVLRFQQSTQLAATGDKDRCAAVGDALAVAFARHLRTMLRDPGQGVAAWSKRHPQAWRGVRDLGGDVLDALQRAGVLLPSGRLTEDPYAITLLFRRRFRMLAGLPHRWNFLPVEALADHYLAARTLAPHRVEDRLFEIRRMQVLDPSYDAVLARAVVYAQGNETARARALVAQLEKAGRDDFVISQFSVYLERRAAAASRGGQ